MDSDILIERHTEQLKAVREDIKEIKSSLKDIKVCLIGNGTVEKSVVFRLGLLENSAKRTRWAVRSILGTVITSMVGGIGYGAWWVIQQIAKG